MSGVGTSGEGYAGQWDLPNDTSDFNKHAFLIEQMLGLLSTATLVQVKGVTNTGAVVGPTLVDVLPLVNLIDGQGNASKHGTVYGLPYFRLQGGTNAIIADPVVGDIGMACFADRDISSVKSTKAQANPGSRRRFSMADGMYFGGFLNAAPIQYVRFYDGGIEIVDVNGNKIAMSSTGIKLTDLSNNVLEMKSAGITVNGVLFDRSANVSGMGTLDATGEGTFNGHTVGAHTHGGVTAGSDTTATPTG